jgi:hypothetical protein
MAGKEKVTKLRIQIPKGMKIEDILDKLEVSFEPATGVAASRLNFGECCVDVAIGPGGIGGDSGGGGGSGGS